MPPPDDLETLLYKLKKRGFHQDDLLLHECPACQERGVAKSWRAGAGMEGREEDPGFDLRTFLR